MSVCIICRNQVRLYSSTMSYALADPVGAPQRDSILSYLHTFLPKSARVGGRRPPPPNGNPGSATDMWDKKSATFAVTHTFLHFVQVIMQFRCHVHTWVFAKWAGPRLGGHLLLPRSFSIIILYINNSFVFLIIVLTS